MDLDAVEFSMPEMDMLIVAADEPKEQAMERLKIVLRQTPYKGGRTSRETRRGRKSVWR